MSYPLNKMICFHVHKIIISTFPNISYTIYIYIERDGSSLYRVSLFDIVCTYITWFVTIICNVYTPARMHVKYMHNNACIATYTGGIYAYMLSNPSTCLYSLICHLNSPSEESNLHTHTHTHTLISRRIMLYDVYKGE